MKKIIVSCVAALALFSLWAETWKDNSTGYIWTYVVQELDGSTTITEVSPSSGENLVFPSKVDGRDVISIYGGDSKSRYQSFTGSLTIPDGVEDIFPYAFAGCDGFTGLLTIPDSVTRIGAYAFNGCKGFTGLTIGNKVAAINAYAFQSCTGFTGSLTIPNSVTIIDNSAFRWCSGFTGSLTILNGVTEIRDFTFDGCGFTGSLTIPNSVTTIGKSAFQDCGFTGLLTIPASVKEIDNAAFYRTKFSEVICLGDRPKGCDQFPYVNVQLVKEHSASWFNGGLQVRDFAGYVNGAEPKVEIVSSKVRENDATVIDVVYKVKSDKPTVKVRALAFEDGERSFAKAVRMEAFIDGTVANVGDGITANEKHTISWKVSEDWKTKLAKVKVEILATEDDLLPLELMTLPKNANQPKIQFSWNSVPDFRAFDALLWLYADKDEGLTLVDGVLRNGDTRLAEGDHLSNIGYDARVYLYNKMGYTLLTGEKLDYVKSRARLDLPDQSVRQYAYRVIED